MKREQAADGHPRPVLFIFPTNREFAERGNSKRSLCCAPGKQRAVGSEFRITLDSSVAGAARAGRALVEVPGTGANQFDRLFEFAQAG